MPRLLAIEWDSREARVAVAQPRGKGILLEEAFAVEFPADKADGNVGEHLAAALAARGIGRSETLVAVGRSSIELRQMSLPPAPEDEWPEMVRFQAQRQFTTIGNDWPLDFVPLGRAGDNGASVLAAAISPEIVAQIKEACTACELTPKRLVLRPFAAASLLCRHDRGAHQPPRLMVDMLKEDADLTALVDQQVILMRTVRLPSSDDPGSQIQALVGEIRRTIAAAQNQMQGKRIEKVILCGDGRDQVALQDRIANELSHDVVTFNPFDEVQQAASVQQAAPEHKGRFAPLIGMLIDEASGASHALDFLHPRKKPEPPNTRRRNVLIAATAAVAAFGIAAMLWLSLAAKDDRIAQLRRDLNGLQDDVRQADKHRDDLKAILEYQDSDITWLDELYELCNALPQSEDVILTRLSLATRPSGGAEIVVDGYARELGNLDSLRTGLRGPRGRQVKSGRNVDTPKRGDYPWQFRETALIPVHSEVAEQEETQETPVSVTEEEGEGVTR